MSKTGRTHNSLRNTFVGVSSHIVTALFSFVSRTVFVTVLGAHYLGISGLFSNILTMLALSDLGIYTVLVYSLYKPLAENDQNRVKALVNFYQKLYNIIAIVVLALGLACVPFLPYLVNGSTLTYNEMLLYYILLLSNSVCSYFAISKSTLLRADQQMHIVQLVSSVSVFGLQIAQILILMLTHQYVFYLIIQIIFTLGNNVVLTLIATKKYPYLKGKPDIESIAPIKKEIFANVRATFLYKIGNTIMNSTDNILISVIVGTVVVGYYSNYVTIYTLVNSFVMIIIQAILPSIGNYYATQEPEKKFHLFRTLMLLFYAIGAFCASCYICGMDDFITLWLGEEFVIGGTFVLILALNRFVFCAIHPLWMTRESAGVFVSTRYLMLCAAAINIALSIALGMVMGVSGIILATALSNILTIIWYEPLQLCKRVFNRSVLAYFTYAARLIVAVIPVFAIAYIIKISISGSFVLLLLKFLICGVATLISFVVVMYNTAELAYIKQIALKVIRKITRRREHNL